MARECIVTGKKPRVGNNVSHANNRTKRRFDINLQRKKFYIPETGEWITLRLTARAIKTISKKGISEVLKELKKQGYELV
ncbi:MAG: 50S ribosomal protein L28 [Bacteroidia bacterium]|nr:50S ribosomal protein L28 [Bacteroidia bacterium]MDW8301004.1 50S ribosomal protein L28 [Bacteroidia bacterium]